MTSGPSGGPYWDIAPASAHDVRWVARQVRYGHDPERRYRQAMAFPSAQDGWRESASKPATSGAAPPRRPAPPARLTPRSHPTAESSTFPRLSGGSRRRSGSVRGRCDVRRKDLGGAARHLRQLYLDDVGAGVSRQRAAIAARRAAEFRYAVPVYRQCVLSRRLRWKDSLGVHGLGKAGPACRARMLAL